MTLHDGLFFLLQCGILFISAVICTTVGFGFGIFANSLMLLAGMTLPQCMPISVTTMSAQTSASIYHLRVHIRFARIRLVVLLTLLFMPLGTLLLWGLSESLDKATMRAIVGGIILFVVTVQALARVKPRDSLHWGWAVLASSIGGVLAGLCGMGGPPLVLWVIAHKWSAQQTRVALWTIFLSLVPAQVLLISIAFGLDPVLKGVLTGIVALPLVLLGTAMGMRIGNRMSKPLLQLVARLLLVAIALTMIGLWVARTTAAPTSAHQTDVDPNSNRPTPISEPPEGVDPPNGQPVRTSATFRPSEFINRGHFGAISRAFAIRSCSLPGHFPAHLSDAFSPVRTNVTLLRTI